MHFVYLKILPISTEIRLKGKKKTKPKSTWNESRALLIHAENKRGKNTKKERLTQQSISEDLMRIKNLAPKHSNGGMKNTC